MRILVIGKEPNIFRPESESRRRIKEYAGLFEELHVISLTAPLGATEGKADGRLFLWPAVSELFFVGWYKAIKIGLKISQEKKIDLIDSQDPSECGLLAWLVSRFSKTPLRIQLHTDFLNPEYRRISWREKIKYYLARFVIARADCLRVVSERIRNSLEKSGWLKPGLKISVLPIFTDLEPYLNSSRDPVLDKELAGYDFKMMTAGRFIEKEKNFSLLIQIMENFIKICPRSLLVLWGSGPDERLYRRLLKSQKLENNVRIEPWRADLSRIYKSFDLFLLSSNYEGWGRAVIEAMASGLPIVMTDVGLAGEVVKDGSNGLVVPVQDEKGFLSAVQKMYADLNYRKKLASSGLETVKKMSPGSREEYLGLYRQKLSSCLKR